MQTKVASNYIDNIKKLSDEHLELIKGIKTLDLNKARENVKRDVIELLQIEKPRIMLCGVYNAGKSTLINALYGAEVASVADRPETAVITEYEKDDYILIDSPGVNAPIEHEEITHDHIKRSNVIFFVISNKGTFEDKKNYDEMINIINQGKELVIVLNNKSGEYDDENHPEVVTIKRKLIENLTKFSGDPFIADKYSVLFAHAKRALRGVLENKPAFYQKSNITAVEKKIKEVLQSMDAYKMLKAPIANFKNIINESEKAVMSELNPIKDFSLEDSLNALHLKRESIMLDLRTSIRQITLSKEDELVGKVLQNNDNNFDNFYKNLDVELEELYKSKLLELRRFVAEDSWGKEILLKEKCGIDYRIDTSDIDTESKLKSDEKSYSIEKKASNSNEFDGSDILKLILPTLIPPTIKIPKLLITVGIPLLGKLFKDNEKDEYERLLRQAEARNEYMISLANEQARIRQEVRTKIKGALFELQSQIAENLTGIMAENFETIDNEIRKTMASSEEEYQRINSILEKTNSIKSSLEKIENNIS